MKNSIVHGEPRHAKQPPTQEARARAYTVLARVYHYAISELCKGLYGFTKHHNNGVCHESLHVLGFTGFDHRRERRRLEYAFLTNASATVSAGDK